MSSSVKFKIWRHRESLYFPYAPDGSGTATLKGRKVLVSARLRPANDRQSSIGGNAAGEYQSGGVKTDSPRYYSANSRTSPAMTETQPARIFPIWLHQTPGTDASRKFCLCSITCDGALTPGKDNVRCFIFQSCANGNRIQRWMIMWSESLTEIWGVCW